MLAHARGSVVWDNMVRTLLLISLTGVAAYAVLIAYVCLFQSRLIYFPNIPGRALTATPAEIGLDFEEVRITTADRIELHVGRDLQFIRINGTIVGGLAGLAIHTLNVLL